MRKKLLIIANNNIGPGQSGGDTIFLEFIKNWQKYLDITVFGSGETKNLLKRYSLQHVKFIQSDTANPQSQPTILNLIHHTLRRILRAYQVFKINKKIFKSAEYCYTVSDFLPDFLYGLIYKNENHRGQWLCGQYLFAPKPGEKPSPYENSKIKGFLYYLFQIPTQILSRHFADQILITSEPDRRRFPHKKVIIVQGGVNIEESEKYFKSKKIKNINKRSYDAVFQGRLHSQKGIMQLVDIWKLVVKKIPSAKLAVIGDGQLEKPLKNKIKKLKLSKNITLFGFKSGQDKNEIFKDSKIVVHPAIYDSGGMAAAEAMAWGLPGVSFDLEALKTYYPQGMLKSHNGNNHDFAKNIVLLLTNKSLYKKTSQEALQLIRQTWDWTKRSEKLYREIFL